MCFLNARSPIQTAAPLISTSSMSTWLPTSCWPLHAPPTRRSIFGKKRRRHSGTIFPFLRRQQRWARIGKDSCVIGFIKEWEPEFLVTTRKKHRIRCSDKLGQFSQAMQVDPALLWGAYPQPIFSTALRNWRCTWSFFGSSGAGFLPPPNGMLY